MGEHGVQVDPAEDGSQRGLRDLGGGDRVVLHCHDGFDRVGDVEQDDGVDTRRHIVLSDDLLGRDGQGDHSGVDPHQAVEEGDDQMQTGFVDGS